MAPRNTDAVCAGNEQRHHYRFNVHIPILVVAVERADGEIDSVTVPAHVLNVSASGALLSFEQPIDYVRVWIRQSEGDISLSECLVRRTETVAGHPHCYGVQFACVWRAETLTNLLSVVSKPPAGLAPAWLQ